MSNFSQDEKDKLVRRALKMKSPSVPWSSIARQLNVNERTLYRWIKILKTKQSNAKTIDRQMKRIETEMDRLYPSTPKTIRADSSKKDYLAEILEILPRCDYRTLMGIYNLLTKRW